jgi:hypothetical protein
MSDELEKVVEPKVEPKPEPKAEPKAEPKPEGKMFSEDYVQGLREEAKTYRLAKKELEAKFRALIGLKDDDELNEDKIESYKTTKEAELNAAIAKANDRLILAEIKSLEGYDPKLVARLLDKSKVTIAEDGTVTGLKEAVAELEKEFPQIKVTTPGNPANPAQADKTPNDEYQELMKQIREHPNDTLLKQKLFLLKEKMK